MCFMQRGFNFAFTSQDGFASIPICLDRSPVFFPKLTSLLIDYDPSKSRVVRLEATCMC